jgi:hypothetical protein
MLTAHSTAIVQLGYLRVSVRHKGAEAAASKSAGSSVRKAKVNMLEELRKKGEGRRENQ